MARLSVFVGTSIDGYLADADGRLDWLHAAAGDGEDYGYDTFLADVDAVAMGRGTYDFIADMDPVPYGGLPVFVFTSRPPAARDGVTFWSVTPGDAVAAWASAGFERVYVDGGQLIASFLAQDLVDDLVITTVPVLLGAGHPLFPHRASALSQWQLDGVRSWPSGAVQRTYSRRR